MANDVGFFARLKSFGLQADSAVRLSARLTNVDGSLTVIWDNALDSQSSIIEEIFTKYRSDKKTESLNKPITIITDNQKKGSLIPDIYGKPSSRSCSPVWGAAEPGASVRMHAYVVRGGAHQSFDSVQCLSLPYACVLYCVISDVNLPC